MAENVVCIICNMLTRKLETADDL